MHRGQAFYDPEADQALFDALTNTLQESHNRRLLRLPYHINDPQFTDAVIQAFKDIAPNVRRSTHATL